MVASSRWPGGGLVVSAEGRTAALQVGSARRIDLPDASVQTVVTSPPYWGLRQYAGEQREVWGGDPEHAHEWGEEIVSAAGRSMAPSAASTLTTNSGRGPKAGDKYHHGTDSLTGKIAQGAFCSCGAWYGALGLEPTPEMYVEHLVEVFREVRRVLRTDGTLWLNLGDSYAGGGYSNHDGTGGAQRADGGKQRHTASGSIGMKPKDLVGIPWMVAFALRADGWWLRSDIIWHKPNPMPESVTDRPTKAHEYVFLMAKSERYFYDADAIREPSVTTDPRRPYTSEGAWELDGRPKEQRKGGQRRDGDDFTGRNKRTVWTIPTRPYKGAHFATFPPALVEPCVLAGSSPKACGVCGAPWERVTDRSRAEVEPREARGKAITSPRNDGNQWNENGGRGFVPTEQQTLGWRSTCEHEDGSGACVVLDPFVGSGTTGQVALRHGRDFAGVDASDEYLTLAVARVSDHEPKVKGKRRVA